ncbi:O-methyltransferase [Parageobacillus thermoglucosidasius]|uniref:Class I SAM-dependent methyltransferase n=1 Tax=Parageobacillus thermoglucosidasius TaxID=1426 RepID=A0AB38R0G1_PARTM|nr:class I SAM-dependent methyltransferase [Parageobacillus thermoglucosidasius]UOE77173.1 class I SAM-dependent methyltransferase [Parageobacillus thermoglucosidasius]
MDERTLLILKDIQQFATEHDSRTTEKKEQMLIIGEDAGRFLYILLSLSHYSTVLELGTGCGYSTIWIAEALRQRGGIVTTVEWHEQKYLIALEHFKKAGTETLINPIHGNIGDVLQSFKGKQDVIFLDAVRTYYVDWWRYIDDILVPGGLLLVDNTLFPNPDDLIPFFSIIRACGMYEEVLVPIGKGISLFYKKIN